ncbi:MAG: gamma-glutamyl-gamma-aminobutyrate hydrolase family protein [Planctomycetota bacterium]
MHKIRPLIKLLYTHNFDNNDSHPYINAFIKNSDDFTIEHNRVSYTDNDNILREYSKKFDALILTGGKDIDPKKYNQKPHPKTKIMSPLKDKVDFKLIEYFLNEEKHIVGICLGCQQLNVFFGGTLYQDIPEQLNSFVHSAQNGKDSTHLVRVEKDSILNKLINLKTFEVVSHHHQAIEKLGKGLKINSYALIDNIIEGIEYPGQRNLVIGIQWHPERDCLTSEASKNFFRNLIKSISPI